MGYGIDSAEWPTGIEVPSAVKQLIERFYQLLDNSDSGIGDILADEIFASDGVAYFGTTPFRGSEEIRNSRANAWKAISMRKHEVLKVYVCDSNAGDLLFTARVAMGLRNGKHVEGEFTGRLAISDPRTANPKLRLYQVWGDTSALVAALREG
ncbi:hypothetical protein B0J13DRAFT_628062 [Dactylonectria estremocensis]|uniref:SnoaL-like domain-containing protein n=1 Tax=Dactylonectria estremocensis TaxID=1079267 RepID=A0A9P9IPF4_9HYPO|nr:hypothetical protein B0J13DRAFT_628062 [Dactylonectria estremocensis]